LRLQRFDLRMIRHRTLQQEQLPSVVVLVLVLVV
jgi:hypothetical protein